MTERAPNERWKWQALDVPADVPRLDDDMVHLGRGTVVSRDAAAEIVDVTPLSEAKTFGQLVKGTIDVDAPAHAKIPYNSQGPDMGSRRSASIHSGFAFSRSLAVIQAFAADLVARLWDLSRAGKLRTRCTYCF